METSIDRKPKLRRGKNFVVEENIEAIRWPAECSACSSVAHRTDTIKLEKKYKTYGMIHVDVAGIPYCQSCFTKSRRMRRLDNVVLGITLILGIPLSCALTIMAMTQARSGSGPTIIYLPFVFGIALALCYGLALLLVKIPVTNLFKNRFIKPVEAWLIEEKKSDGREGLSVVIAIPNKSYADKFFQLNGALT